MDFTTKVATYFRARPNQWIDARELEAIGGRMAWRSRVSDCRTQLGMTIENKQKTVMGPDGKRAWKQSLYRFVPKADDFQLSA